jgi:hypothetical protein
LTVTRGGHIAAVCFRLRSPPDLYFATHRLYVSGRTLLSSLYRPSRLDNKG